MSKDKKQAKGGPSLIALFLPAVIAIGNIWFICSGKVQGDGSFIFCAVLTLVALIFTAETHDAPQWKKTFSNITLVLSLYPVMKLILTLLHVFCATFWEGVGQFLGDPAVETGIIVAIDLLWLWMRSNTRKKKVEQTKENERAAAWEKELAGAKRIGTGPDGSRYSLPDSYKEGAYRVFLYDTPSEAARRFHNEIHQLLWYSEMADMFYKTIDWNKKISWESSGVMGGQFWSPGSLSPGMAYEKFFYICTWAIDEWKKRGDIPKAVHYSDMLFKVSTYVASSDAWFYYTNKSDMKVVSWRSSEKIGQNYFLPLFKIYQEGAKNVQPAPDRAAEYQRQYEQFLRDAAVSQARGDKLGQEFMRTHAAPTTTRSSITGDDYAPDTEVSTDARSSGTSDFGDDFASDDSRGVSQLPGVMTDGDRHRYVRSGGPGAYPAQYHCAETGDTVYIYRAVLHGGYADTDCGAFYY